MTNPRHQWLDDQLEKLGRKKSELAEAMGVSPTRISELLNGRYRVPVARIPAMSKFLEMPVSLLVARLNSNEDFGYGIDETAGSQPEAPPAPRVVKLSPPQSPEFREALVECRKQLKAQAIYQNEKVDSEELEERAVILAHALIGLNEKPSLSARIENLVQIALAMRAMTRPDRAD